MDIIKMNKEATLVDGYWVIGTNKWNSVDYKKEKAEELAISLINCENCRDCENCTNCTNCIWSKYCKNCTNCEYCNNCEGCKKCNSCYNCTNCEGCEDCVFSENCKDCHEVFHGQGILRNPERVNVVSKSNALLMYFYDGGQQIIYDMVPLGGVEKFKKYIKGDINEEYFVNIVENVLKIVDEDEYEDE